MLQFTQTHPGSPDMKTVNSIRQSYLAVRSTLDQPIFKTMEIQRLTTVYSEKYRVCTLIWSEQTVTVLDYHNYTLLQTVKTDYVSPSVHHDLDLNVMMKRE
ncbi:hypothetical protein ElyMa_004509000 [Elysia marginata]|uniref:Uncharacterized protein n=1 Tax=Elysia marginata TaxID=1093978 RepID=A0AAV4HPP2_9GAST|nr:hypothetical protein ElyMa_004509000 [Elysia marginata]